MNPEDIVLPTGPAPAAPTSDAGWIDLAASELTVEQKIRVEALNAAVEAVIDVFGTPNGAELLDLAASFEAYIRDGAS